MYMNCIWVTPFGSFCECGISSLITYMYLSKCQLFLLAIHYTSMYKMIHFLDCLWSYWFPSFLLQTERIIEQLLQYVTNYDITGLKDFWEHLDGRFFKRLDYAHYCNVKKLETCLLRLYVVHALQNSKSEKVVEFFEKYATELQSQSEWKEWFGKYKVSRICSFADFYFYFRGSLRGCLHVSRPITKFQWRQNNK